MNNELLDLIDCFIKKIDNLDFINEYKEVKLKLLNNKLLLNSINEYKITLDENLKHEIYNNLDYRRYCELENEIYYLILNINQKFNGLTLKKGCAL